MAPTQILAKQHFAKIAPRLKEFGFDTVLLTSDSKNLPDTLSNPHLIVTTHAILHNLEKFGNIGLIVIDEQHKFGVAQRSKVIEHFTNDTIVPNLLTMTATPIPRSLALTLYGDLDLSVIDELPVGRKKVSTKVIDTAHRADTYTWIENEISENKNQVYIVCPFIDPSDIEGFRDIKATNTTYVEIKKRFPKFTTEQLHGKTQNKDDVIQRFRDGEIQILVATPVIEVGVDVPNANIMVIENPERFGLASLHQLRGRVGRGKNQAYCVLFANEKIQNGIRRIKYLETVYDGNKLAEIDLKLRGPGNIYGMDQHGFMNVKIADITDFAMVKLTKEFALKTFQNIDFYPIIKEALLQSIYVDDQ